jgi:hypothetical protein
MEGAYFLEPIQLAPMRAAMLANLKNSPIPRPVPLCPNKRMRRSNELKPKAFAPAFPCSYPAPSQKENCPHPQAEFAEENKLLHETRGQRNTKERG